MRHDWMNTVFIVLEENLKLYEEIIMMCFSTEESKVPPPADEWQHQCHCRSLSSGPLCLHIALWKRGEHSQQQRRAELWECSTCTFHNKQNTPLYLSLFPFSQLGEDLGRGCNNSTALSPGGLLSSSGGGLADSPSTLSGWISILTWDCMHASYTLDEEFSII